MTNRTNKKRLGTNSVLRRYSFTWLTPPDWEGLCVSGRVGCDYLCLVSNWLHMTRAQKIDPAADSGKMILCIPPMSNMR